MGLYMDSILGYKDSLTGSAFEALTAASGDSFSIRWFEQGTHVTLLDAWGGNNVTKCDFSIRSPLMHDNVRGLRFAHMFNPTQSGADGNPNLYLPPYWKQPYHPTDTLIVEVLGAASDDVTFCQSILYETPSMAGGRFLTAGEVQSRTRNLVGIRCSPPAGSAVSTWGAAEALNTDDDRLKANTDYAFLGLTSDLPFTAFKIVGPDTANLGIAVPGYRDGQVTSGWFYEMARRMNMPLVPVINSNNKGVTNLYVADAGGSTAPLISLLFAELG